MRFIVTVVFVVFLIGTAVVILAAEGPETVVFEPPMKDKVTFYHHTHQKIVPECKTCHHNGVDKGACRKCHDGEEAERFMRKSHVLCRNCHKTKGLPYGCTFCHKK